MDIILFIFKDQKLGSQGNHPKEGISYGQDWKKPRRENKKLSKIAVFAASIQTLALILWAPRTAQ